MDKPLPYGIRDVAAPDQLEEIAGRCRHWMRVMGLEHYDVVIQVLPWPEIEEWANIEWDEDMEKATIQIAWPLGKRGTNTSVDFLLIHELAHIWHGMDEEAACDAWAASLTGLTLDS